MRKVAIIPARSGSKRLPKKNIVNFLGNPIINYSIKAALNTNLFQNVFVTTDSDEIAVIARKAGANVIMRENILASDTAKMTDVIDHVLRVEAQNGREYEILCLLYATAPLRNSNDIVSVVELIDPGNCDFAMAVTEYSHPAHQALKITTDNTLTPMWPSLIHKRSQEICSLLVDNGSTYAATVESFQKEQTFFGPGLRGHVMPRERSVDIDYPVDLKLAQFFAEND